jgi:BlaI family penicillinase repressor
MIPKISDAEWRIMRLLWKESPRSAIQLAEDLSGEIDWSIQTIKTLLNRLVEKKALTYHKKSRAFYYSPLVSEEEVIRAERDSFLSRVYKGALKPLLTGFLEDKSLSKDEIAALKKILEDKEKKGD